MANREANVANAFETTLTASFGSTALTATVDSTSGLTSPCYLVVDPDVPAKREYIYFDGSFTGTTVVTSDLANRYLTGSAAGSGLTHDSGAVVRMAAFAQLFQDLHDRVEAHTHSGGTDGTAVDTSDLTGFTTVHDADDHSGVTGFVEVLTVVKTADETVNNSATLQNDDELVLAVEANSTYLVEMWIISTNDSSSYVQKGAFSRPSGASLSWSYSSGDIATGSNTVGYGPVGGDVGGDLFSGILTVAGSAGSLQYRWAQSIANANDSTVKSGSWLKLTKVA